MTSWRAGRMLAVGALLAAGAAVYFNLASGGEAGSPTSISPVEVASATVENFPEDAWRADAPYYDDFKTEGESSPIVPEDEWRFDSPYYDDFRINRVDPGLIGDVTDFFDEDVVATLGYKLLAARLGHYQADGSLTSRDLERLDQEIDMLMIAAARESSEAQAAYQQEIERLEDKIRSLLDEAAQDPSINLSQLNREIERLDNEIDMLSIGWRQ